MVSAAERPNVVVFLADDQGWGDLGINGNTDIATPNIDSLAKDGAMLDRFFVCPVCAPNCSFFTNWETADDFATWDIEVGEAAVFEAILWQTCTEGNVGVTMELEFQGESVHARVPKAWDPPLVGLAEDRSDRGSESFVKEFRPFSMGEIHLPKGRGTMTLRAVDIPGAGAIDVRYVVLVKKS